MTAVVAVGVVFNLGQGLRSESLQRGRLLRGVPVGRGAFVASAAPDAASGAGGGIVAPALADQADASPAGAGSGSGSSGGNPDDLLNSDSPAATFQQVYWLLKDEYVDKIPSDAPLAHGAAAALIASLDEPNSRFVDKAERDALDQQSAGLYSGIGAVFTVRKVTREGGLLDRQITIIDALPGSPAAKAGLQTGDVVVSIDGHWIISYDPFAANIKEFKKLANDQYDLEQAFDAIDKRVTDGYSLSKAQTVLDAPAGSLEKAGTGVAPVAGTSASAPPPEADPGAVIKLEVQRPGAARPIDVTIDTTTPTQVKDVESRHLPDGSGYIVINQFDTATADNFKTALDSLGTVKGLVIDLRDCPGGLVDPAVAIGKGLVPAAPFGDIVVRRDRVAGAAAKRRSAGKSAPAFAIQVEPLVLTGSAAASAPTLSYHGPISVLVNAGTANSAELLAAFLHDQAGARVIGSPTFGDALAQTEFPLSDGSAFTLTTGQIRTDRKIAFWKTGLAPEYRLADAGHAGVGGDADAAIAKGEQLIALGAPPPGPSAKPLLAAVPAHAAGAPLPGASSVAEAR